MKSGQYTRVQTFFYVVTAVLISAILVRVFLIDSFTVEGNSMAPTIIDGDYIFVNKLAYRNNEPERGDIVVGNFRELAVPKVIKRVIGLPHEWLRITGGEVTVSENRDSEGKIVTHDTDNKFLASVATSTYEYRLDPYEYFLLGDNLMGSVDSRELGPIDSYHIDGRVFLKLRLNNFTLEWL